MSSNTRCNGWCVPTVIYMVLAIISTLSSLFVSDKVSNQYYYGRGKGTILFVHILIGILWTGLLYWMCLKCMYTKAWFLLLVPLFVVIFGFLILMIFVGKQKIIINKRIVIPGRRYHLNGGNTPLGAPELRRF